MTNIAMVVISTIHLFLPIAYSERPMSQEIDLERWQSALLEALRQGDEDQARALTASLRETRPRAVRAVLERMLESPEPTVRQAAVFGLGALGGPASARRLEQQLLQEEARSEPDGSAVAQVITQTLGLLASESARAPLLRKLNRLATGTPEASEVDDLTYALWRKRHPEMVPAIQSALQRIAPPASLGLRALLRLLEASPEQLRGWVEDDSVPIEQKTKVLTVLDEEFPEELLPLLPSFIFLASSIIEEASTQKGEPRRFCNRLFTLLLLHRERLFPSLPPEARVALREVARRMVAAPEATRIIQAATILEHVGQRQDANLLDAHRPDDEVLSPVFDEAAATLRRLPS